MGLTGSPVPSSSTDVGAFTDSLLGTSVYWTATDAGEEAETGAGTEEEAGTDTLTDTEAAEETETETEAEVGTEPVTGAASRVVCVDA